MTTRYSAWILATAFLALPAVICAAETAERPASPLQSAAQDYQIGPNDQLGIEVYGVKELEATVRVSASGSIATPYMGRLYVAGLTPTELEDRIRQELKSRALVREPQVGVTVLEYNSQPIYVLGAVKTPGQFMMSRTMSVVDAITMAGGLDPEKAGKFVLVRRGKSKLPLPNDETVREDEPVFRIDLTKLLEKGDVSQDIALQGGDVVQVPARKVEMFYVIGEVQRPGAYEFKGEQEGEMLATRALGWAGGGGKTADLGGAVLIRNTDGGRQEIALDFKRILKGKDPDTVMQADDIIFVPGSTMKNISNGLLTVLPATLSGIVIWNSAMSQQQTPQPVGRR
jgi:polysaccharide export outer membrane protein